MHVHLDPIGGMAGDMFVAAMVDAWPELATVADDALGRLDLPEAVEATSIAHHDDVLAGRRFVVRAPDSPPHRSFRTIRALLERSGLAEAVRDRALDVFTRLAEAEAMVHDVEVEEVEFHEVGAWDSLADVVAAAATIEGCGATSWSVAPLPLGSGSIETAHGVLPVPAPATVVLLDGLPLVDDGVPGERVTPTGAAILQSLGARPGRPSTPQRIHTVGTGFGSRRLAGRPNLLRVLVLVPQSAGSAATDEVVGVVELDVDDQTAEDLAVGLERLRAAPGVLDVVQRAAYGKKGRLVTEVRVLCAPAVIDDVVDSCLRETTTLGVRWSVQSRVVLDRREEAGPDGVRVKSARRPDGRTSVKAEMDELIDAGDRLTREERRRRAENAIHESTR